MRYEPSHSTDQADGTHFLGLFGAWGGTTRPPDIVGDGVALDLALSGRPPSSRALSGQALDCGLFTRIESNPRTVAEAIAANDARPVRTITWRIRDGASLKRQEQREAAAFGDFVERIEFD